MDNEITNLCEEFCKYRLKESPELCTYVGCPADDQLDTFTEAAYELKKENYGGRLLSAVKQIRQDGKYLSTSFASKVNLEVLQHYLQVCVEGLEHRSYLMPMNMYEGVDISLAKFYISRMPFNTEDDYALLANRLKHFSRQVEEIILLMKEGMQQKIICNNSGMSNVITRLDHVLNCDVTETPYYTPFMNIPESISEEKRLLLREEGKKLITEEILRPLVTLRSFLFQEYIPSCRQELGVYSLPDGAAKYASMLRFHCDVDLTPEQVHQIGHEQVTLVKTRILKVMEKLNFSGTMCEFFKYAKQDRSFYCDTQEELLQYINDVLEKSIRPKLGELFKPAPKYDLLIAEVVQGMEPLFAEYYAPSAGKPAVLYFPRSAVKWLAKYDVPCLMLHETEPGHHFQSSYMVAQEDLPRFRRYKDDRKYYEAPGRFPLNTAYTEGWGLYCEELGEELGIYDDPYVEYGYLTMKMARAIRLVIDTGIHAFRWTREQALAYMAEYSNQDEDRKEHEIDRYITLPGQACAYTLGHLKIREIREKAATKLGSKFDVKEFHEVCLKCGQLPLQILEQIVDNYIEETLRQNTDE